MWSGMRTVLKPVADSESLSSSQPSLTYQCESLFSDLTNKDGNVRLRSTGRLFHADVAGLLLQLPERPMEEAWGMQ